MRALTAVGARLVGALAPCERGAGMGEGGQATAGGQPDVLISAIEHYAYCPRQCALIHVEQTFDENLFTMRGRLAHERADSGETTSEDGVRVVRSLPLWSEALRLRGRADVVELRPDGPYPIEYKSGGRRTRPAELQLCAQALCLEEMLGVAVPRGAVYLVRTRRREEVALDAGLRAETRGAIEAVRRTLEAQQLPEAPNDARCPKCSLINACLPSVVGKPFRLRGLQGALFRPLQVASDA